METGLEDCLCLVHDLADLIGTIYCQQQLLQHQTRCHNRKQVRSDMLFSMK